MVCEDVSALLLLWLVGHPSGKDEALDFALFRWRDLSQRAIYFSVASMSCSLNLRPEIEACGSLKGLNSQFVRVRGSLQSDSVCWSELGVLDVERAAICE